MIDIIAQTAKDVGPVGIGVGVGGLTLGSLVLYLVKRKLTKVCDHVDDSTKHVDPSNGYIRKSFCNTYSILNERNFTELKGDINAVNVSVSKLHERVDRILEKLSAK